ncbi:sensor histidine kinase [Dissulfuribacter thermophilus]|uniref:histidine kinase n=1 Tax=Dissulfuribacter thermophilus TaxID=1156395 RepID=A0A1B9F3Y9_9BACT|nr:ATP-binding protein [Dissulfuribacter thermophilus]OCC14640.1 sensor histidine kinase [Dissulfuribacter thermophilus]
MIESKDFLSDDIFESWKRINQPGVIHDGDRVILANEDFLNLFGYSRPDDVVGRSMGDFISPWPSGSVRLGRREYLGRRSDGTRMELEVICLPVAACEGILYQTLIKDLSSEKNWEIKLIESERLTAMGKIAGEIAHEINNPLGGILLYANLLKEDIKDGSSARENLDKIIRLATRCRIIVKALLNFGRSSSKAYSPVDLNEVIREMYSMIEDHRMFREINVVFNLSNELPHFMGDKGQIEQIVLNLLINAAEAIEGPGTILVSTEYKEGPFSLGDRRSFIRFTVEDTGHGIPEDLKNKIFEPFFTTKQRGKGTGLGLSITRGIVQRHGGKISCESQEGRGTKFTIEIPVNLSKTGSV